MCNLHSGCKSGLLQLAVHLGDGQWHDSIPHVVNVLANQVDAA